MPYTPPGAETLKALETAPNIYLVLSPELVILTASDLYLEATNNKRAFIVGKHIFEAFPDNPELPDADGVQNINASLQQVLRTKQPHYMRIQRYETLMCTFIVPVKKVNGTIWFSQATTDHKAAAF